MTESEFNELAEKTMAEIEQALDACDADIDYEMNAGVLEIEFANGTHIVVNRQAAMQEIWIAAKSGGFHYGWKDGAWRNTRDSSELFESLSGYISEQAGEAVSLR